MFDTLITVIAKGFVFTQYSYLVSGFWYYGDGLLTVVYLLVEAINVQFSDRIAEPYSNYLYGIAMLTVLFRVLRLVREIKNSITLSYFRILLYILGKLVLQLFPLLVLSFFVILISAVLAMNTMDGERSPLMKLALPIDLTNEDMNCNLFLLTHFQIFSTTSAFRMSSITENSTGSSVRSSVKRWTITASSSTALCAPTSTRLTSCTATDRAWRRAGIRSPSKLPFSLIIRTSSQDLIGIIRLIIRLIIRIIRSLTKL